jgi:hypothetical protein
VGSCSASRTYFLIHWVWELLNKFPGFYSGCCLYNSSIGSYVTWDDKAFAPHFAVSNAISWVQDLSPLNLSWACTNQNLAAVLCNWQISCFKSLQHVPHQIQPLWRWRQQCFSIMLVKTHHHMQCKNTKNSSLVSNICITFFPFYIWFWMVV